MTRLECHVASAGLHEAMVGFSTAAVSGGGGEQLVLAYMLRHMPKPYAQADNPIHRRRSPHSESLPYSSLSLLPSQPLPSLPSSSSPPLILPCPNSTPRSPTVPQCPRPSPTRPSLPPASAPPRSSRTTPSSLPAAPPTHLRHHPTIIPTPAHRRDHVGSESMTKYHICI